jgi:cob(I)alamin adenosyltransferase
MPNTPEYLRRLDAQIDAFRQELKPLEEGILYFAERKGAYGHWEDTTQRHITRLKGIIDNLAAVRAAVGAGLRL